MPSNPKNKSPLVFLANAPNEVVANLWKGVLEENGIQSMLKSVNLATSLYVSMSMLQYEIYVLAEDEEKAREILTPFFEGENDQSSAASPEGSETDIDDDKTGDDSERL